MKRFLVQAACGYGLTQWAAPPENLWAWIRAADAMGHDWKICRPVYNREKKEAFEKAGLSKLCNVLRHSFCSYHVALHQDAAKTALLMQHTNQAMLYRHYKGEPTAKRWGQAVTNAS